MVMEVNSSPGLEGIQKSTGVDVAEAIIEHIERELPSSPCPIRRPTGPSRRRDPGREVRRDPYILYAFRLSPTPDALPLWRNALRRPTRELGGPFVSPIDLSQRLEPCTRSLLLLASAAITEVPVPHDAVLHWNETALQAIKEDRTPAAGGGA